MVANLLEVPPRIVYDKKLRRIDVRAALFKRDNGVALNLGELAVVSGYDYKSQVRKWPKLEHDPLPLFEGKITWPEFQAWKRRRQRAARKAPQAGESPPPNGPATAALRRRSAAGKSDGSLH